MFLKFFQLQKIFLITTTLTTLVNVGISYKILGLFPHTAKSHFEIFRPLVEALAEKGHDVTVVSPFPRKQPLKNFRDISLEGHIDTLVNVVDLDLFKGRRIEKYANMVFLAKMAYAVCEQGLSSKPVQKLIKSEDTYDLIIIEQFNTDCFMGFAHKFKVPVISMSSCTTMQWLNDRFANPNNPAYVPSNMMDFSDEMTFIERVENTFVYALHSLFYKFVIDWPSNRIAKKYFGDHLPPLSDLAYNTSLMLVNAHFSLTLPRPQVPQVVDVSGIHVGKVRSLPSVSKTA